MTHQDRRDVAMPIWPLVLVGIIGYLVGAISAFIAFGWGEKENLGGGVGVEALDRAYSLGIKDERDRRDAEIRTLETMRRRTP
jgi:hypothetical protein